MAYIRKVKLSNNKTSYRVRIRIDGKDISKSFRSMGEARNYVLEVEGELESGAYSNVKGDVLCQKLFERYVSEVVPHRKHPEKYLTAFNFFIPKIGHLEVKDITLPLLHDIRQKLIKESKISFTTINRYFATVGRSFAMGIEWEMVLENPFSKLGKLKEPKGRVRFLSDDERERLLAECKKVDYLYLVVIIALTTGARKSEIMTLKWSQINFKENFITLEDTKNDERRALPLCKYSKDLLLSWKDKKIDETNVFNIKQCRRSWPTALKASGVKDFRFHDLRHSCASYLAMQGVPLLAIADILGHKTLDMVKRYAHLSNDYRGKIIDTLGEYLFPEEK
ncbi:MAG: site-specific integrase [Candidatus Cloacimonetes bacterium]|nr:site-specific integrase [Candidatus Cloacimonadota bacterium]